MQEQSGKGEVKKFRLDDAPTFFYKPTWSPDSRKIAFTDKKLNLSFVELESRKVTKVDTGPL